jgi:hypothetical protein
MFIILLLSLLIFAQPVLVGFVRRLTDTKLLLQQIPGAALTDRQIVSDDVLAHPDQQRLDQIVLSCRLSQRQLERSAQLPDGLQVGCGQGYLF